jgi:hypothetical protein
VNAANFDAVFHFGTPLPVNATENAHENSVKQEFSETVTRNPGNHPLDGVVSAHSLEWNGVQDNTNIQARFTSHRNSNAADQGAVTSGHAFNGCTKSHESLTMEHTAEWTL